MGTEEDHGDHGAEASWHDGPIRRDRGARFCATLACSSAYYDDSRAGSRRHRHI